MAGEIDFVGTFIIKDPEGDITLYCQSLEGGAPEVETGGMTRNPITGKTKARNSLQTGTTLTIEVEIDLALWLLKDRIDKLAGCTRYEAFRQFSDANRVTQGAPDKYYGWLGTPDWGKFDINGGDNTAMLTIESGCDLP